MDKPWAICEQCGKTVKKLGVHVAQAHNHRDLECDECGKKLKTAQALGAHKAGAHNPNARQRMLVGLSYGLKPTNCLKCGEMCKTPRALWVHNVMTHESDEVREAFLEDSRQKQIKNMADLERKARMMSGILVDDRSKFYSEERRKNAAEIMRRVRLEHPESCEMGGQAYAAKMREMFPRSEDDYPYEWNGEVQKQVKNRDKWACVDCGVTQNQLRKEHRRLAVHHLDSDKDNLDSGNLVTVCYPCHMLRHHEIRRENGWKVKM